ncbi:MAG: glycosyltransferase 87 family protein [Terracidiphilus sp.]
MRTPARLDGLILLLLGAALFLLTGAELAVIGRPRMADFDTAYYSAKCALLHLDPYSPDDVLRARQLTGASAFQSAYYQGVLTRNVYPPSEIVLVSPLAWLPFGTARVLWFALIAGGFILAALAVFNSSTAPRLDGVLLALMLLGSGSLMFYANPAGIEVALATLAVVSIIRQRYAWAGVLALAAALALKPHDSGFLWLCLLLAGGIYRRRAWQALAVAVALSIPAMAWLSVLAPHWPAELAQNLHYFSTDGQSNTPYGLHGACFITSLQVIFAFLRNSPGFYNIATWLISAPLLLAWAWATVGAARSEQRLWLSVAAIAALSMVPIYHRQYDAKLIILTVPACALLWKSGSTLGRWALWVTVAVFLLSNDLMWAAIFVLVGALHLKISGPHGSALLAALTFPVPLSLLALGVFYLWALFRFHPEAEPVSNQNSTP